MIITNLPDLDVDEGVLAEIPNIEVKSIEFRLFLTNRRLILIRDGSRGAPVIVPLQVVRSVRTGRNFADDPVINLSLSAPDGSNKKMTLSFIQDFSGIRDKECDQLKKVIEGVISESRMTVRSAPKPKSPSVSYNSNFADAGPGAPSSLGSAGGEILSAANVVVKSQEYTVSLTNEKIVLTDPNRPNRPSSIPVGSVRSAEGETGGQGEPAIVLLVEAQNGNMRRMVLKFSLFYDKNRWGERETWVRAIQDLIATGSIAELYRPTGVECAPQTGNIPPQGGFSAKPPGQETGISPQGICPNCGTQLSPSSKFCGNCGSPAPSQGGFDGGLQENPCGGYGSGIIDSDSYGDSYGGAGMDGGYDDPGLYGPAPEAQPRRRKKTKVKKAPKRRRPAGDDIFGSSGRGPVMAENSVAGRLIGFIRSPGHAFQMTKGQDAVDAAVPFGIVLAVFALGNSLFLNWYAKSLDPAAYPLMSTFADLGTAFFFSLETAVFAGLAALVYGVLMHLALGLLGFRSEINDGLRIGMYASVPLIAAGIIPVAGLLLAPLWMFYLFVTGARETYGLSGTQALTAAVIPAALVLIVFYLFVTSGESNFAIFGGA